MSVAFLKRGLRAGAVGGIAVIFFGAVGMIEQFNGRDLISDIVTLGKFMVAFPAFLAGYLAVRPKVRRGMVERLGVGGSVATGAVAGATAGMVLTLGIVLVEILGVESV